MEKDFVLSVLPEAILWIIKELKSEGWTTFILDMK